MLTSLIFTLIPPAPLLFPLHLGRASHAAFLRLIAQDDPLLAEQLHAPDERRPFTCSNVWGLRRQGESLLLAPGQTAFLRYTGLTGEVSRHLERWAVQPPARIEIDGKELTVQAATLDPAAHPWAGRATYEGLASAHLLPGGAVAHRADLEFAAPATFRSGGRNLPLPLPALVYGGLLEKWNAFAPVALPEETRRFAEECLAISRYRLATQAVGAKGDALKIGFTGHCQYTATNRDRYWLSVIQLLTDYAFYAGVGAQTTVGMGQARRGEGER